MKTTHRLLDVVSFCYRLLNRVVPWHRLPKWMGIVNLIALRHDLRRWNLYDTDPLTGDTGLKTCPFHPHDLEARREDGSHNDLRHPNMGRAMTPFGRNAPLSMISADARPGQISPSPRDVSRAVMTRTQFVPATSLNLLAAAWIQFQVHDWFGHQQEDEATAEIKLQPDDEWHERPMKLRPTKPAPAARGCPAGMPVFLNTESHWWDASQLYGSGETRQAQIRSRHRGQLTIIHGRLPSMDRVDPDLPGVDLTGFNDNYWVGLSLFHTLFALEHNAICAALHDEYPSWSDDQYFHKARLINAALIAKIHTVEWTPGLLQHPTLDTAMRTNWWGLFGESIRKRLGRLSDGEVLGGIPGSPTEHHAAPYCITEEFAAVYRLHPLIPDDYRFYSLTDPTVSLYKSFPDLEGNQTRPLIDAIGTEHVWYSFGLAHPGKLTLGNFPRFLQEFRRIKPFPTGTPEIIDLAAVDIFRDRERGVPRYNDFRRMLRMKPIKTFEELNAEWAKTLRDLYDNVERLDLMVGLFAEEPPAGFAISDTAFRIFTLMAPRRLKSDRFFTADFRPEVYTPAGIDWVQNNDLTSLLLRHYPSLAPAVKGLGNAFLPWHNVHATT